MPLVRMTVSRNSEFATLRQHHMKILVNLLVHSTSPSERQPRRGQRIPMPCRDFRALKGRKLSSFFRGVTAAFHPTPRQTPSRSLLPSSRQLPRALPAAWSSSEGGQPVA